MIFFLQRLKLIANPTLMNFHWHQILTLTSLDAPDTRQACPRLLRFAWSKVNIVRRHKHDVWNVAEEFANSFFRLYKRKDFKNEHWTVKHQPRRAYLNLCSGLQKYRVPKPMNVTPTPPPPGSFKSPKVTVEKDAEEVFVQQTLQYLKYFIAFLFSSEVKESNKEFTPVNKVVLPF